VNKVLIKYLTIGLFELYDSTAADFSDKFKYNQILPTSNMAKTIQLGIRIDRDLFKRIEQLAKDEGIDKMEWIRRALAVFVGDEEAGMSDEAIEDYINLRIDEKELLQNVNFKEIPNDISEARQKVLEQKMRGGKNG
jgi:predicted transcriptional regulator